MSEWPLNYQLDCRQHCVLRCDLSSIPKSKFAKLLSSQGECYYRIDCTIDATFYSAEMKFELTCHSMRTFSNASFLYCVHVSWCKNRKIYDSVTAIGRTIRVALYVWGWIKFKITAMLLFISSSAWEMGRFRYTFRCSWTSFPSLAVISGLFQIGGGWSLILGRMAIAML